MAPNFQLLRRDNGLAMNSTTSTLTIVLVVLLCITLILVGTLLVLRQRRRKMQQVMRSLDAEKRVSTTSNHSNHRRTRARFSQSIHIYQDKEMRVESSYYSSAPSSPTNSVPEIRITFPEEVDESGKRQSGRVVVVHVGDTGVGYGPVDEKLPQYEQLDSGFQSVDLEKVGGLIEKESRPPLGWK
jgi:hypothetical protein